MCQYLYHLISLVGCLILVLPCWIRTSAAVTNSADTLALNLALPQILTTDLSSEIAPSLSPNGKWLLYSSSRNGNYDIWIRPAGGGVATSLTTHPADDYSPVWSPKGDEICFVSNRDDPEGDLYSLKINFSGALPRSGTTKLQLSEPGAQSSPTYAHAGKYLIYQDNRSTKAQLMLLRLANKSKTALTPSGFVQPRCSPQDDRILCIKIGEEGYGGDICSLKPGSLKSPKVEIETVYSGSFPAAVICWSPDATGFIAALVNRDSNHDGLLTLSDRQAIYRFDPVDSLYNFRPVTIGDASESFPFWAQDGYIYYSSDRRGNPDLWRALAEGPIPQAKTAQAAYNFAVSIGWEAEIADKPLSEPEFLAKLLAFDKVRYDFPSQKNYCAESMLASARLLSDRGQYDKAETYLKRIPRFYADQKETCAEAEIDYQIQVHSAKFDDQDDFSCENPASFITNLRNILNNFTEVELSVARCYYLIGAALEMLVNIEAALEAYNTVADKYPNSGDYPALALLRIGGLYAQLGSGDEALQTYLLEIDSFSQREIPTKKAIEKVINLRIGGNDPIAGLQDLIGKYSNYPALAAAAQQKIAELLAAENEGELAISEYDRLRGYAMRAPIPYVRARCAESLFNAAQLENQRGDYNLAQARLQEVQDKFADLQNGYFASKAKYLRLAMLADRAELLTSQGDNELARALFEQALILDPKNVRLQRGRITAATALRQLKSLTEHYQRQLSNQPDDPTTLYSLGLCLSYAGQNNPDELKASNVYIQRAIAIQPDLAYGYLTLSYNYEQQENLLKLQSEVKRGFISSTLHGFAMVASNLGRLLTLRKAQQPIQGYELAIETLQLGLAVNDEADNPRLEAQMLLNLGNNYYRLGEFGYPRALTAYQQRLRFDSTFTSKIHEAVIRERMGQAAAITGKNEVAVENYKRSLNLYHQTKHPQEELRALLRLAEIYQVLKQEELSNEYYTKAITLSEREGLSASPTKWLGNIAFNSLELGDTPQALTMAQKAITSLPLPAQLPEDKVNNPLVLEFLGVPIPVLNFGYLGTGSPMSAFGLTKRDELILNYSIAQEVYNQQKDLLNSQDKASQRLAIALQGHDRESEAIQWSEIGFLNWAQNDPLTARRCFLRSYLICSADGYRAGKLSALINLATIALSSPIDGQTETKIYASEADWLGKYAVGMPAKQWQLISQAISKLSAGLTPIEVKKELRNSLQILPDPLRDQPPALNWGLISDLLLLKVDPFPTLFDMIKIVKAEVDNFQRDPIGFSAERIKCAEIYAQLSLKAAAGISALDPKTQMQKLELEGEALWAYQIGIEAAKKRGLFDQEIILRMGYSDFLLVMRDFDQCASELNQSLERVEEVGRDDLRWRIYFRLGQLSQDPGISALQVTSAPLQKVRSREVADWFDQALTIWANLPPSPEDLGSPTQSKLELKLLLELAASNAIKQRQLDQVIYYAQYLANLPLWEAVTSREISVQFEKRKYYWGDGGGVIPFLRKELQDLKQKIAVSHSAEKADSSELNKLQTALRTTEKEYNSALEKIQQDDPEYAALFSRFAFDFDTLRNSLRSDELFVQILELSQGTYILTMTQDTINITPVKLNSADLSDLARKISASFQDSASFQQLTESFCVSVFQPIQSEIFSAKRLYLAVPSDWSALPLEWFWMEGTPLNQILPIYRLPDLQSLVFAKNKKSLGEVQHISFDPQFKSADFTTLKQYSTAEIQQAFETAGSILLHPHHDAGLHPFDHVLFEKEGEVITIKDLLRLATHAEVLFIVGSFPDEAILVRMGMFAGFANVILIPDDLSAEQFEQFMGIFNQSKVTDSPAGAFEAALKNLTAHGLPSTSAFKFRYYGDGGMNKTEREQYARRSFKATVLKGNYNLEHGDGEWALRYYDRALAMAEEINDSTSIIKLHQLRIQAAKTIPRWDEAVRSQQFLLVSAREQNNREAILNGLRNLSIYEANLDSSAAAIATRMEARKICLDNGDDLSAAGDDRVLAALYEKKGDYTASETAISAAGEVYLDWGEYSDYMLSGIYRGRLLIAQENFIEAQRSLVNLANSVQKASIESGKTIQLPAEYYQHLGLALEGMTDYSGAIEAQKDALNLLGDSLSTVAALSHQYLAGLYWKFGRYQDGLDELQIAKKQFSELKNDQYVYLSENIEALIYLSLGDADRALEQAKDALDGAISSGDQKSRSQIEKNVGLIELSRGDWQKAKTRFLKALQIDEEIHSQSGRAYAYLDLSTAFIQMNLLDSAKTVLDSALMIGEQLGEARVLAKAHLGLGLVLLGQKDTPPAIQQLTHAYVIAEEKGLAELSWRIDLALARALELQGQEDNSLVALERAMNRIEAMRASITAEALKSGFMEDKQELYKTAAAILLKQKQPARALAIAERSRSRTFLDLLQSRQINRKVGLDPLTQEEEEALRDHLSKSKATFSALKAQGAERTPEEDLLFETTSAQIDSLEEAYAQLLEKIESQHPGYRDLVAVNPDPPEKIQALLRPEEALVEYYALEGALAIFVLKQKEIKAEIVPVSEDSLTILVTRLRNRVEKKLAILEESQALYRLLVSPIEQYLIDCKQLVFIPTGPLHYLPFSLLQNAQEKYILDTYPISYAPSASIFSFCRQRARNRQAVGDQTIYAYGNPNSAQAQEDLFFTEKEVITIGYTFKNCNVRLGNQANESRLIEDCPAAGTLHLACHGQFDAINPLFSSLFLTPDKDEDGRLQMFEILNLDLNQCALVTLSACESGLSGIVGGEEIVGLNRAFIYAGTPRLVSTLWKVDDLASAILIKHFYRNLQQGMIPVEALRAAQFQVRDRITPHPAYWAAFQLTGEPGNITSVAIKN